MRRLILSRPLWLLPLALWTLVVGSSLAWNWNELDLHSREIALERARFVFKVVESVRLWNARHGGVYAAVDSDTQPNPHLEIEERDISTPSGKPLTLMNPSYMTRQLTSVVKELSDISVHLTSLKPINPGNAADAWERRVLNGFQSEAKEVHEFVVEANEARFRFMAPLLTKQPCLKCHEKQGYKVGDIRGGMSVSFDAAPMIAPQHEQKWHMTTIHFGVWLLLTGLTLVVLSRFREQMLKLEMAKAQQDRLVEQRTAELRQQVSERERAEGELRLLIDSSGEGICGINENGSFTFCNPAGLRLLGYRDALELIGRNAHQMLHRDASHKENDCDLLATIRNGRVLHTDSGRFQRADGNSFQVELRSHPIVRDDRLIGAVVTFSDITERKVLEEKIWHQAHHDLLTGLPNRTLFHDRLNQTILKSQRTREPFALLFVDLDRFKAINDTFGHQAGDELLRECSRRLKACVRESDTIARMGGDEFNLIITDVATHAGVERVVQGILERMSLPFEVAQTMQTLTVSIGIAWHPSDGSTAAELSRHADSAMYRAKQDGRNTFRFFHEP